MIYDEAYEVDVAVSHLPGRFCCRPYGGWNGGYWIDLRYAKK